MSEIYMSTNAPQVSHRSYLCRREGERLRSMCQPMHSKDPDVLSGGGGLRVEVYQDTLIGIPGIYQPNRLDLSQRS